MSHLVELRSRLLKMSAAIGIVFLGLLPFSSDVFEFVSGPVVAAIPGGQLIATAPAAPLLAQFKLAFIAALFIAMPVVLYQTWAFVAPGLYRKEKKFAVPLVVTSILLFYAGVAFAYFVLFPLVFNFFVAIAPASVEVQPDISMYIDFVTSIVLAFGIAFEVPIATVLMVMTGLTTPEKLSVARPYVFLAAFVIGMLLTPPDFISQTLLAVPVYLLYELGILMSKIVANSRKELVEEAEEEAQTAE